MSKKKSDPTDKQRPQVEDEASSDESAYPGDDYWGGNTQAEADSTAKSVEESLERLNKEPRNTELEQPKNKNSKKD